MQYVALCRAAAANMKAPLKILIGLAAALAIVPLAAVVHHYQLKSSVTRYRAELKARGEPMELAGVAPPPISMERNAAPIFQKATALFCTNWNVLGSNPPPMMRMVAPGKAMIGWMQSDVRECGKDGASNSWAEIGAALKDEQPALDVLHSLPLQPVFDFDLNYADGFGKMKYSSLAPAKKAAQRLAASAVNHLRQPDTGKATRDIQAMLGLGQGLSHNRTLISELVRIAVVQTALTANWEFLQSTNITDEHLASLQGDWSNMEFIQTFENAMCLERTVGATDLTTMRASGLKSYFEPLQNMGLIETEGDFFSALKIKYKCTMWRYWWSYPDELRELKGRQSVIEAARQARTNNSFHAAKTALKKQIDWLGIGPNEDDSFWFNDPAKADYHYVISSSMKAFETAFDKVMKVEATKQLTITAIALKRFQLKHGSYPAQLAELAPEFLSPVPLDPVDGQPLRYRRNTDGTFTLYSIGENGKDDGGNPSLKEDAKSKSLQWQHSDALDWVWPQPATAAEVQKYFEEKAK
jgi:hypothetical protein